MIDKVNLLIRKYTFTLLFAAVVIAGFTGYQVKKDTDFSQTENRYLAGRPDMSISSLADGSFMSDFESYCNEQIPFRDWLVKARAVCGTLMGRIENNGIAVGRNGFLFEKNTSDDSQLNKNILSIEEFIKSCGRDVYVAAAPTSSRIYAENLPKGMPVLDEKKAQEKLEETLSGYENADVIDLYPALMEEKSRREGSDSANSIPDVDDYLYYRTDHHWTSAGAYTAYKVLAKEMGFIPYTVKEEDGRESICGYDKYTADDFYGTYYAKYLSIGIRPDTIEYYDIPIEELVTDSGRFDSLYDLDKLKVYDKYAMFCHGNCGLMTIQSGAREDYENIYAIQADGKTQNNDMKKGTLVILKDSYANCLIPFLTLDYEKLVVLDLRYYGGSVKEILKEYPDSDILLLYNWAHVNEDNHFYKLVS